MLHIKFAEMEKAFVKIYLKGCTVLILNISLSKKEMIKLTKEEQDGSLQSNKTG